MKLTIVSISAPAFWRMRAVVEVLSSIVLMESASGWM
jgi:hypothetical protein